MQETEGAHHWMGVFDELRQRGVEDVLFVSMDGVSGLADGLRAIFPDAVATWERSMAEVERLFSYGPDVRRVMYTTNAVESVNASFRKVVRRGCFPDEDAVMKLLYLRVKELYSRWGEGCHQPGWARVRNQLLCDEGIRARIERFL